MKTYTCSYKCDDVFCASVKDALYFDIETTGLQSKNAIVCLIGCAHYAGGSGWSIHQWFAENPDEEKAVLEAFSQFASGFRRFAHYNGMRFDIPFLTYRFQLYNIKSVFEQRENTDFYLQYKPVKKLLSLPDFKQKTLEAYTGFSRKDTLSGKDCVTLYRKLVKYRDLSYSEPILLHNKEDLLGLISLNRLQSLLGLLDGSYRLLDAEMTQKHLLAHLELDASLPQPLSIKTEQFTLTASRRLVAACFPIKDGALKNFYADYQNYYYLPNEDMAVHKSVGIYTDKSRRKKASPENCYTRFVPDFAFLEDKTQLATYVQHNLSILLEQYCRRK